MTNVACPFDDGYDPAREAERDAREWEDARARAAEDERQQDRAYRAATCPNAGDCCERCPDEPAEWCDCCRWDYDVWMDRLAAEGRALDCAAGGWDYSDLLTAGVN